MADVTSEDSMAEKTEKVLKAVDPYKTSIFVNVRPVHSGDDIRGGNHYKMENSKWIPGENLVH